MQDATTAGVLSEPQFAALVDSLAADPVRHEQLTGLLREDNALYDQRGAATVARMRGWVLLALARVGVSDATLIFVLEELDTGIDPYLVAAAACALRSYPRPNETLAPFVMRALGTIRRRDQPVSFEGYGQYAVSAGGTSAVRELLATLTWLGPSARGVLLELETLRAPGGGLPTKLRIDVDRALQAIRGAELPSCCGGAPSISVGETVSWPLNSRHATETIESIVLEDQTGERVAFETFFKGHPTIVVFFYTRCDNPLKCSLTITKLARLQGLLEAQGLSDRIRTAAITYDPAFDLPERLRVYGQDRGVRMNARHLMLRTTEGHDALRKHFELGVNYVESLVNRHRIEVYVLDAEGRIAVSFERIHWDEQDVVARAIEVMNEGCAERP